MSFKYWKKHIAIWASNGQVMGFLQLLFFCWYVTSDQSRGIVQQSNRNRIAIERTKLQLTFFHLELELFVLDLKVYHSNSIILNFLSWFANTTNSKPNNLPFWQSVTKHTYNRMPIYNKMPKYITNSNLRLLT